MDLVLFSHEPPCAVPGSRAKRRMRPFQRALPTVAGAILCVMIVSTVAAAPPTTRVVRNRATIWNADFVTTAAVVRAGTVLTMVNHRDDWIEVVVPGTEGAGRKTGFIYKANVEATSSPTAAAGTAATARAKSTGAAAAGSTSSGLGFVGFGQFAYTWFSARNSFEAVLGDRSGAFFGGGAEFRAHGFFVNGTVEHFSKTGQRVFVDDGEVFKLGVSDTIDLMPISFTAGWRFVGRHVTPYGGGGVGQVRYKETSAFSDPGEDVDEHFASYHGLGGVEFRNGWVATAFEVAYSRVAVTPGTGAMTSFGETNLGGFSSRVKILIGWSGDHRRD
jgi:hypothetical protein